MHTMRAALSAAACAALLVACGGTVSAPAPRAADEWEANAADVIGVLERDLALSMRADDTIAAARQTLRDISTLYTIVVAFTDFGGCDQMISAVGAPAPRLLPVERTLRAACAVLQHAATVFTRAIVGSDAVLLKRAMHLVLRAAPLLSRAAAEIDAARIVRSP